MPPNVWPCDLRPVAAAVANFWEREPRFNVRQETWQTVRLQFKLKISNLDQHRKDVLQILGCNVTAGVWAEIPENILVEGAIVDVELMSSSTIFSVVISWILF
jgi:hypothetical protein